MKHKIAAISAVIALLSLLSVFAGGCGTSGNGSGGVSPVNARIDEPGTTAAERTVYTTLRETTEATTEATTAAPETQTEAKKTLDRLVLVNQNHKLPSGWYDALVLTDTENAAGEPCRVEEETLRQFRRMQKELRGDGLEILLASAYRSEKRQQEVWDEYIALRGEEYTKKYVAKPGYSEHQTGLAVDVWLVKDGAWLDTNEEMFAEKELFAKVHARLSDYGFILRYPKGKEDITGYGYEPWHFRYVGV